jgi:tetratricopeptide (TPR) repeat protein
MTPQELVDALLQMNEEQGRRLLQSSLPGMSEVALNRLVKLLKKETDQHWNYKPRISLKLSGYLICIGDESRNASIRAVGLLARGDALRRLDYDQESLPYFDAAGEEFLALGDEIGWARTRIGRVSACTRLNRTTEALRDAGAARDIFWRYDKFLRAGQMDTNAAIIHYELGHYERALRLFDRAIETYTLQANGSDLSIARARANKALALAALGRFREALALHEQARAAFVVYEDREEVAVAREDLNMADIYAAQGYYSRAVSLYNRSRDLFIKHDMKVAAAEVALQVCFCLGRLNRTCEALELVRDVELFFRSHEGQGHNLARALMQQATIITMEGENQQAYALLQEASDLLEAGGFVLLAALARLRRAELHFKDRRDHQDRQLETSLYEAQDVADVFADQEDLPHLAQATFLQASIASATDQYAMARELCLHALAIAQGQNLLELQYLCYDVLGQLAEHDQDMQVAASYYDQAIRGIDEVQSRLALDSRISFLEDKRQIYQRAVLLALKRGKKEQALTYIEKSKSRVLVDYLRNTIDIRLHADEGMDGSVLEKLKQLREEQAWFSSIVYGNEYATEMSDTAIRRKQAVGVAEARREMQRREHHIERLFEQLQLRSLGSGEDADEVFNPSNRAPVSGATSMLIALRPYFTSSAVLLEYYVADQDLYIFAVAARGLEVRIVPDALPQLEKLLALWNANLDMMSVMTGSPGSENASMGLLANGLGLLHRLYALLLRPVEACLAGCAHVTIVPYGILHYLPFHCLYDGARFLIERMQVSYLPTAVLFDICQRRGRQMQVDRSRLRDALVMGLSGGGQLPYATREAAAVAQQLSTSCILNEEATASCLWAKGSYSPIVHIAAHGLFRLDAPNFSYIQLADRQLSTIDVFNLDLSSCSLVTLSACETGRAVIKGVDEVIGLGRGFLYAGAASLLSTLWKVDDASSAALMDGFYRELVRGASKVQALAVAQRAWLSQTRSSLHAHPYFWGAFHLIGDTGPVLL